MDSPAAARGLILFDLDGTLIDSRADLAAAINRTRLEFGLAAVAEERIAACVGEGLRNLVTRAIPELAADQADNAVAAARRHYGAHLLDATTLYPGVRETLEQVHRAGYRLGVLSNKPHEFTVEILERLGLAPLFTVVMGGAAGRRMKPHPEAVLEALRQSGCAAADSWVVGDHFTDLEAGRRAGVRRCFCTYGFGSAREEQAELVVHSLPELAHHLLGTVTPDAPTRPWSGWLLGAAVAACMLTVVATMLVVHRIPMPCSSETAVLSWKIPSSDLFVLFKLQCLLMGGGAATALTAAWLASQRRRAAPEWALARPGRPLLLAGGGLLAVAVSTLLSAYPQTAVWGFPEHGEGLLANVGYLLLFGAACLLAANAAAASWLAAGVLAGATGVSLIALAQAMGWDPLLSDWARPLIGVAGLRHKSAGIQASGTLGNPNYFGSLAALAVPLAVALMIDGSRKRAGRWAAGGAAAILLAALVASQSRAGLVGVIAGLAVLGWLCHRRRGGHWSRRGLAVGAGVICLAAGLLLTVDLLRGHPLLTRLTGGHMDGLANQAGVTYRVEEDGTLFLESPRGMVRVEVAADDFHFLDGAGRELPNSMPLSKHNRPGAIPISLGPTQTNWSLAWLPTLDGLVLRARESSNVIYYFLAESDGFHPALPSDNKKHFTRIQQLQPPAAAGAEAAPAWWMRLGSSRGYIWVKSLPMLPSCWLSGHGPDTFAFLFPQQDQAGKQAAFGTPGVGVSKPHNLYLGLLVGAGLPALLLFLGLAGLGMGRAARMAATAACPAGLLAAGLTAGLASYLLSGLFNDAILGVAPAFWLCLGMACAAVAWPSVTPSPGAPPPTGFYDIKAHRRCRNYRRREMLQRLIWGAIKPLFRFSPRICFGWRNSLLRGLGARIGRDVHIYNSAVIYFPWNLEVGDDSAIGEHALVYNLGRIRIGARCFVSHGAHLCAGTHDYRRPEFPLIKPPITLGDDVWVAADAFIGPGTRIGNGAVVGARAVVVRDVAPGRIVAGNPAKTVASRPAA